MFNKYYKEAKRRVMPFILILAMLMQTGMGNVVLASDMSENPDRGQTESTVEQNKESGQTDQGTGAVPAGADASGQPGGQEAREPSGQEAKDQETKDQAAKDQETKDQEASGQEQNDVQAGSPDVDENQNAANGESVPVDWTQKKEMFRLSLDQIVYQENDQQPVTVKSVENRLDLSGLQTDTLKSQELFVRFEFDQAKMTEQLKAGDTFSFYVPREYIKLTDSGAQTAAFVCSREGYEAEPSEIRDTENFGTYVIKDNTVTVTVTEIPASGNLFGVIPLKFEWNQKNLTAEGTICELSFQDGITTQIQVPKKTQEPEAEQTEADSSQTDQKKSDQVSDDQKDAGKAESSQKEHIQKAQQPDETVSSTDSGEKAEDTEKKESGDGNILKRFYRSIVNFFIGGSERASQNYAGGHSFSNTYSAEDLPDGFRQVKLTVSNRNGGYQTDDDLRVNFKFHIMLDEDYLYTTMENEIMQRADYPVQGNMSDSEYEAKMVEYLNQLEAAGELPVLNYSYDLGEDFSGYSSQDIIDLTDSSGAHCGTVVVQDGAITFHFDGSCYFYDDIIASVSMEAELNQDAVSQDPIDVAFGDHGELIHQSAGSIDGGSGGTEDHNYSITKEAPMRVTNSEITYTVKVEALKEGKTLNGLLVTDTLAEGLELKSVTYGDKELNAPTDYKYDQASRTFTYQFKDLNNQITAAEFTLTAGLIEEEYQKVIDSGAIDRSFVNQAELKEKEDQPPLEVSDEVTTNMKFTFLSKQGQEEQLNGTRYSWTITANTQLPYLEYGYLVDTLCFTDHQYDFERGITVHTQKGDIVYTKEDISLVTGGIEWGESLTAEGLQQFITDNGITGPFYYLYDSADKNPFFEDETATPDEPEYKQMAVLVLPFTQNDGWTGTVTQEPLRIKYFTDLNLHGLSVDDYLLKVKATPDLNPKITNRATLLWHNEGGKGPGPQRPDKVDWDKTGSSDVKAMSKKGVSYNEKTQELTWRMDVNRYGASLKNVVIEDVLPDAYALDVNDDLTVNMRKYNQISMTEEADSPITLTKVQSIDPANIKPGTYTISKNAAGKKVITMALGDLVSSENGAAVPYCCVLDFKLKLIDPTYLAVQSEDQTVSNQAKITAKLNGKPFEDQTEGSIKAPNHLIDKTAVGSYNYRTHELTWQVEVNPNKLPIKNAVITDTLPQNISGESLKDTKWTDLLDIKKNGQSLGETEKKGLIDNPTVNGQKITFKFKNEITDTYSFTFASKVTNDWIKAHQDEIAEHGFDTVENLAQLNGTIYGTPITGAEDTAEHTVDHMKVGKSGVYNAEEGTIAWTVLMNVDQADISGMHLVEDLTKAGNAGIHELDMNSIKVETVQIDENGSVADQSAKEVPNPDLRSIDAGAAVNDLPDARGFAFYIPSGSADHQTYRITFTTELLSDAPSGDLIQNKVYLNRADDGKYDESNPSDGGYDGNFDADHMVTKSTRPRVTMTKASGNSVDLNVQDKNLLLEEAKFLLTAYTFNTNAANTITLEEEVARYNKDRITDGSGDALFLNIKAKSSTGQPLVYQLVETEAPKGYQKTEPTYIVFTDDTKPDYTKFTKVTDKDGNVIELNADANYFIRKATSDKAEETMADLMLIDKPVGSRFTFGKEVASGVTYDNAGNASYTYIALAKDSVVFKITWAGKSEGQINTQYVSNDANGNFTIENLDPGTYTLTEVKSPANMTIGAQYKLTVTPNDTTGSCDYQISGNANHNTVLAVKTDGTSQQVIQDGYLLGSFSFTKQVQYEDTPTNGTNPNENRENLGKTAFQLTSTSIAESSNTTFTQIKESDGNGKVEFKDIPVGEYILTEGTLTNGTFTEKVGGYVQKDSVKVIVTEKEDQSQKLGTDKAGNPYYGKKTEVTYQKKDSSTDAPDFIKDGVYSNTAIRGTISFTKVQDAGDTGLTAFNQVVLGGAEFGLYRKIGTETAKEPTYTETTGVDGKIEFDGVEYGDYILQEITVPAGYKKVEPISINRAAYTITDSSGKQSFTYNVTGKDAASGQVQDSLKSYTLKFHKQDQDGNPLSGIQFNVYRRNSGIIGEDGTGMQPLIQDTSVDSYYQYQPLTKGPAPDGAFTTPATDDNGDLEIKNLPYGDYLIVENTAGGNLQEGYGNPAIHVSIGQDSNESEQITVRMTQNLSVDFETDHYTGLTPMITGRWNALKKENGSYTIVNQKQHIFVQIHKVTGNEKADQTLDSAQAQDMAGVRFAVYEGSQAQGTPYLTLETNSEGAFEANADGAYQDAGDPNVSRHLWAGKTYTIKEISAPEGFDMVSGADDTKTAAVIGGTSAGQGDTFYIWRDKDQVKADHVKAGADVPKDHLFVNAYSRGNMALTKVDAEDENIRIEGAEFQLKVKDEGSDKGRVAAILKDSGNGKYTLAPVPDTILSKVTQKEMENGLKADYLYNAGTKEAPDYRILTGTYTIEESKVPDGYIKADQICKDNTIEVSASGNRDIQITLKEDAVRLKLVKKAADTGVELSGAQFTVTGRFKDDKDKKDAVKTLEQANSQRAFLTGETYILHEKTAPYGFLAGEDIEVRFNERGEAGILSLTQNDPAHLDAQDSRKQTIIYADEPLDIQLLKTDETDQPLAGAVFTLTGTFVKDGVLESTQRELTVTSEEKSISLTRALNESLKSTGMNLAQGQTYQLKEIKAPDGYIREKAVIGFKLTADGTIEEADKAAWKDTGYRIGKDQDDRAVIVQLKNEPTAFALKKISDSGQPQKGVEFTITPKDGSSFLDAAKKELKLTTGAEGTAEVSGQLKHGNTYTVHEEKALPGYHYAADFEISVDEDGIVKAGEIIVSSRAPYAVVDKALDIRICKKDDTGREIQGIAFTLTKENADPKETWSLKSNADGLLEVTDSKGNKTADLASVLEAGQSYVLSEEVKDASPYAALQAPVKIQISREGRIVEESLKTDNPVLKDWITLNQDGLTLEIRNDRTELNVQKADQNGQPLEGARLGIYSDDQGTSGSLVVLDGRELKWFSEAGRAFHMRGLPTGIYWLKETGAPTGYVTADPIQFELKSDNTIEIKNQTGKVEGTTITMTDEQVIGAFTVVKTQSETNTPVEGAVFALYQQTGENPADTDELLAEGITTKADGTWSSENSDIQRLDDSAKTLGDGLTYGRYYLKEMSTPDAYQLDTTPITFTIEGRQSGDAVIQPDVKTVRAENAAYSRELKVEKQDREDQSILEGAVFILTRIKDAKGNEVAEDAAEAVTDSTGTAAFTIAKKGTYRLAEIKAPNGYADASVEAPVYEKEFTVDDDTVSSVLLEADTVKNVVANERKTGTLTLTKQDGLDGQELDNVIFTLYRKEGEDSFQKAGEFATGNSYVRTADQEWEGQPDEAGKLTVAGLPWGTYYIEETLPLDGYVTNDTRFEFHIGRYESDIVLSVDQGVITNTQTEIQFYKSGLYNESCSDTAVGAPSPDAAKRMEGVTFTAYTDPDATASSKVAEAVSDADGKVVFKKLAIGTYYIRETALPDTAVAEHYKLDEKTYVAVLDQNGQFAGLKRMDGTDVADNTVINDVERTDIVIEKVDEKNPDRKLPGSTYGLFKRVSHVTRISALALSDEIGKNETGKDDWVQIAQATTDEKGILKFTGVLMDTEYQIRELIAPDGSYVSGKPLTISFKVENGKAVIQSFDDGEGTTEVDPETGEIVWKEPQVEVEFSKKDEEGKLLSGAKLEVQDAEGNVIESWTSEADKTYTSYGKLVIGKTYYLVEKEAPDGYKIADPVEFTIPVETVGPNENKVIHVEMIDQKIPVKEEPSAKPGTGDKTDKVEKPDTPLKKLVEKVRTGDYTNIWAYILMLAAAMAVIIGAVVYKRKRK